MTDSTRLLRVMERAVSALAQDQLPDGSFSVGVSLDPLVFESLLVRHVSTFPAAIILAALQPVEAVPGVEEVRAQAADFLWQQRSEMGTFNYWPRGSELDRTQPYPDDLDDTFYALAALYEYRPKSVSGELMASVVTRLTHCEAEEGGPYCTWFMPASASWAWRDVDLGVNANVAYFLLLQGIRLPNVSALMEAAIRSGSYTTPYYSPTPYAVMYFLARSYDGSYTSMLRRHILRLRDEAGWWGNALYSALAVTALLRLGEASEVVKVAVMRLVEAQQADGSWPAMAMYVEAYGPQGAHYVGSSALTTALVTEALARYVGARRAEAVAVAERERRAAALVVYEQVVAAVRQQLGYLDDEMRHQGELALERQLSRDGDRQIVLLPYYWEQALQGESAVSGEVLVKLGMASLYGWLCYTVCDDLMDEGVGGVWLPVALWALREVVWLFDELAAGNEEVVALVQDVLQQIDEANAWEAARCRAVMDGGMFSLEAVPDYGDMERLAQRSLGHALGPLCLLLLRGWHLESKPVVLAMGFFRHYLIARQLNDDVHDWEADLRRGQVNAVGALLLGGGERQAGGRIYEPLDALVLRLTNRLWQGDIEQICQLVKRHTDQARRLLGQNPVLSEIGELTALLEPLDRAVDEALVERERAQAFIGAYQNMRRADETQLTA